MGLRLERSKTFRKKDELISDPTLQKQCSLFPSVTQFLNVDRPLEINAIEDSDCAWPLKKGFNVQ